MATLGVNIDHVATLRQQRGTKYPDPIDAAILVQNAGADQITVHLREDRRHIQDRDVKLLKQILQIPLNLEIGNTKEMIDFALTIRPNMVTLVPEKREERTTEGGLNLNQGFDSLKNTTKILQDNGIPVSLFVEPNLEDIELSMKIGAKMVELHTGRYAEQDGNLADEEFERICKATKQAHKFDLIVHSGHGLHYRNAKRIAKIEGMCDLNIGHSIISYAVLVGLERAVQEMKAIVS
ncbi:pyridoxine 5'-phosphate synthase [Silvanigrella paludirubra]|uniref:Pyridoxine 5'-phosphate synthase n=1 Tax=Silvanigrella paludirubra TaxID=2499159 RepID=A0A6N6VXV1_9BACT|nr:pyridoxine 5'-phosphate synthase [Silvanigrella paludirubra]KAB8040879.1 pyridoxine 5'-phosphate synthase [Silvanigrella paludirubra]